MESIFGSSQTGTVQCPNSDCKVPAGKPCVRIETFNGLQHQVVERAFIHKERRELQKRVSK